MTKIVLNLEEDRSFLMKSIKMEFYGYLGIESCLRSVRPMTLWLGLHTSDTRLAELLYISIETGPGISMMN